MAFIDVQGHGFTFFPVGGTNNSQPQFTATATIDADGEKVGWILLAPEVGSIKRIRFRLSTVTQAPTSGLRVSIQALGADGFPDGVQLFYRDVTSGIVTNANITTGIISDDGTDDGAIKTVTKGERFAVVIEFVAWAAGDSLVVIRSMVDATGIANPCIPNYTNFTTAWQTKASAGRMLLGLQDEDDVWVPYYFTQFAEATVAVSTTSASTPDVIGNVFVCPVPLRVDRFRAHIYMQNNNATFNFHLYDENDQQLATASSGDPDVFTTLNAVGVMELPFAGDPVELEAEATYRVVIEATGTGQIRMHGYSTSSVGLMNTFPYGPDVHGTVRKDLGAWTPQTTTQYHIGLRVTAIDPVKAAGGGRGILRNICNFMRSFLR